MFLCVATVGAAVIEIRNYIEYPALQQFSNRRGDVVLTLYHRGAARRSAMVLFEQRGRSPNTPEPIAPLHYLEENGSRGERTERFEELAWTLDGSAVFATRGKRAPGDPDEILWLYDFEQGILYRVPDATAVDGGVEMPPHLLHRYLVAKKGGPGETIARRLCLLSPKQPER